MTSKKAKLARGDNHVHFMYDDEPYTRVGVEFVDISPHAPVKGNLLWVFVKNDKLGLTLNEGIIHIFSREDAREIYRACLTDGFQVVK